MSWTIDGCLPAVVVSILSSLFVTATTVYLGESRWADVTPEPEAEHVDLSKGTIWIFSGDAGLALLLLRVDRSEVGGQEQLWPFFYCEGSPSAGHSPLCWLALSTCGNLPSAACLLLLRLPGTASQGCFPSLPQGSGSTPAASSMKLSLIIQNS